MDDVVQAAMDRSRWIEKLFSQAQQQFESGEQATASLRQYVLDGMNAAGPGGTVTFEQREDLIGEQQRQRYLAARETWTAIMRQIHSRLCEGPDEERRAAAIFLLATDHWWWDAGWSYGTAAASAGGWSAAELKAAMRLLLAAERLRYEDICGRDGRQWCDRHHEAVRDDESRNGANDRNWGADLSRRRHAVALPLP